MTAIAVRPLVGGRSASAATLEEGLRSVAAVLGGDAFLNGAPQSYAAGSLDAANLSPLIRLSNAFKQEQYAIFALQFPFRILEVGVPHSVNVLTHGLPDGATLISASFAYAALSAGTSANVNVSASHGAGTIATFASATAAPATGYAMTVSSTDISPNAQVSAFAQLMASPAGGGASDFAIDGLVTLICKAKHVV